MNEFERLRRNILINQGGVEEDKVILYEEGLVNTGFDVIEEFNSVVTISHNEIKMVGTSSIYPRGVIGGSNKVNLTDINKVVFNVGVSSTFEGLVDLLVSIKNFKNAGAASIKQATYDKIPNTPKDYELNVSDLTGEYYVVLYIYHSDSRPTTNIHKISLR